MKSITNFKIIDFRFASITDMYDNTHFSSWSRVYEYAYVMNFIQQYKTINCKIHNTAWGSCGEHISFKDILMTLGGCVHSDKVKSTFKDTVCYDILTENIEYENVFDFVINISTLEHISKQQDRMQAIQNLFKQVKVGGYLILTFDYPRVNLAEIELLVNSKCDIPQIKLTGENSISPNIMYNNLNVIYLILQKI